SSSRGPTGSSTLRWVMTFSPESRPVPGEGVFTDGGEDVQLTLSGRGPPRRGLERKAGGPPGPGRAPVRGGPHGGQDGRREQGTAQHSGRRAPDRVRDRLRRTASGQTDLTLWDAGLLLLLPITRQVVRFGQGEGSRQDTQQVSCEG